MSYTGVPFLPLGAPEKDKVYLMPQSVGPNKTELRVIWDDMQELNRLMGDTYYEGLVAKNATVGYPIQTIDPERTTVSWIKHRFIR